MASYPNFMMRACNCFPWIEECLWLQALRANRKEKLSMELKVGLFLKKDLKSSSTLVWLLDSRYFLRVWFGFGGLRLL